MPIVAGTGIMMKHLILSEGLRVAVRWAKEHSQKRVRQKVDSGEAEDVIEAIEQLLEERVQSAAQWVEVGRRFVQRMESRWKRLRHGPVVIATEEGVGETDDFGNAVKRWFAALIAFFRWPPRPTN